jgi:transcriptional regulator with XRE-family HTH domain
VDEQEEMARAFGDFVLAQRKMARLSQRQLARESGVSDSYLSQMERGMYRPSPEVMKSLAQALGLSPYVFYAFFGLLDDDEEARERSVDVEEAIGRDRRLTSDAKQALAAMYRALVAGG